MKIQYTTLIIALSFFLLFVTNACTIVDHARMGHIDEITTYIESGGDINASTSRGETILSRACENGYYNIAQYAIQNGADVNSQNILGETPLIKAIKNGHLEIVILLIENGGDPLILTNYRKQALDIAKNRGHIEIENYLTNLSQ